MAKIMLKGVKKDGGDYQRVYDTGVTVIWLVINSLSSLDLSPLAECKKLEFFTFDHNTRLIMDERFEKSELPPAIEMFRGRIVWLPPEEEERKWKKK